MKMRREICQRCRKNFSKKTIGMENPDTGKIEKVPAVCLPPCEWKKVTFRDRGLKYTILDPWGRGATAKLKECYDLEYGVELSKPSARFPCTVSSLRDDDFLFAIEAHEDTVLNLEMCPACGCWHSDSKGRNWKCSNCGRGRRKEYSERLGRPPEGSENHN